MTSEPPGPPADEHPPGGRVSAEPSRAEFLAAYEQIMRRWPGAAEPIRLVSRFGTTAVRTSGPTEAPPLLLVPAFGATSAEWIELAIALSGDRRLYAVDMLGDAGSSVADGQPVSTPQDMVGWLDTVLDGLQLPVAELAGHSYGAWIALHYALARPARVQSLTLLDPTMCFAPLVKGYIFRAIPVMLKATGARRTSLIEWETRKAPIDPEWLALTELGVDAFSSPPTVPTTRPRPDALRSLDRPVSVIVSGRSRVHEVRRVARDARKYLPRVGVDVLPEATHYGLPLTHAAEIAAVLRTDGLIPGPDG